MNLIPIMSTDNFEWEKTLTKSAICAIKRHERRKKLRRDIYQIKKKHDTNKRHIKNFSNLELTQAQINLLSRGLKFIPISMTNENHTRTQLLNDFKAFVRRMRLQYIFYGQDKEPHSFYVKSNWQPEEVKTELAEVKISNPKNNLPINESRMSAQGTYRSYCARRQTILLVNGEPLGRERDKQLHGVSK